MLIVIMNTRLAIGLELIIVTDAGVPIGLGLIIVMDVGLGDWPDFMGIIPKP